MTAPDTTSSLDLDSALGRVSAGEDLSTDELTRLAESQDILPIGMLADAVRRRNNGTQVTFLRVALVEATQPVATDAVPAAAREGRLTGSPETLQAAVESVTALRAIAGDRTVSGFSWVDVEKWAVVAGSHQSVLKTLRTAGLDSLAELPLDYEDAAERALADIVEAGLGSVRLTITRAASIHERLQHFFRAAALFARFPAIIALAPLPLSMNPLRPTTGYDDVKAVALARLAVPRLPHIQLDWLRYGPKLAQVALTFGADDLDNVSPLDDLSDGRRRGTIEELRKNIGTAGFTAVERDGRFATFV